MNYLKQVIFPVALILVLVLSATASAMVELLDGPLKQSAAAVRSDQPVSPSGVKGWQGIGGDSDWEKSFLVYDIGTTGLSPVQGTIVFEMSRGEIFHREAPFSLADGASERLFVLRINWDGASGSPELSFFGGGETDFWYVRNQENFNYPKPAIPIGIHVSNGQKIQVALTWGVEGQNRIFVNGKDLYAESAPSFKFPKKIAVASKLIIGAETSSRVPEGAWSMTASPMTSFRVFERALNAEEIQNLNPTPIKEVIHDAFSAAGYSGKLVSGEALTVKLLAVPGGKASFDIVQPGTGSKGTKTPDRVKVADVPLVESLGTPGTYTASYVIRSRDVVENGVLLGQFVNPMGVGSKPLSAVRPVDIDGTTHIAVNTSNDLVPADETARSGLTVVAADANGKAVQGHELKLTLSTTEEYTGTVGGGTFEDLVGGELDVDWGGVTDSFGEVTAQYVSGFAAKTILVSAKDMVSGDVGVGWVRSYIDGSVDIVVTEPVARALSVAGSMDVSLSRDWLTADGKSRSRITAVVKDVDGEPLSGHTVQFTLLGDNGEIRVVQGKTDSRGRAFADYIAGILMGQVQVEVRDLTSGMVVMVGIELRPDAPAEIILVADPAEVVTGGESNVSAKVTDANGNPNHNVDVRYNIMAGKGELGFSSVATDEKGNASVTFTAGDTPGLVTVRGTVISREPTAEEISAAEGAVFLYGLDDDPGRLDVVDWLVKPGDEVVEGQALVVLEDRADVQYTVIAPRDGTVATFVAEERDRVEYGDTLGYVLEVQE